MTKEELQDIVCPGAEEFEVHSYYKGNHSYELKFACMYEPPTINFESLMKLSELFGTRDIDVDEFSKRGCETCDWGSSYGHTIQIINPTRNVGDLEGMT